MSFYAYRDELKQNDITAKEARSESKDTFYYCPNKNCDAILKRRDIHGIEKSHFAALRSHPHIDGCCYGSTKMSFNPEKADEDSFDSESAILALMTPTKSAVQRKSNNTSTSLASGKERLETLGQIYKMCLAYAPRDLFNGTPIWRILFDERSASLCEKGIFGTRIVEVKPSKRPYDKDTFQLEFVTTSINPKYALIIKPTSEELFWRIVDKVMKNRERSMLIAGNWSKAQEYNSFKTDFVGMRQLKLL